MIDVPVLHLEGKNFVSFDVEEGTQKLSIMGTESVTRTVTGEVISPAIDWLKYKTEITGKGLNGAGLMSLTLGDNIHVACLSWVVEKRSGEAKSPDIFLSRTAVPGSLKGVDIAGELHGLDMKNPKYKEETVSVVYRPKLSMILTNFSMKTDQVGRVISWTLVAEEK
ncbi:hypothetical protein OAN22_00315 [Alphaproteobacteria bacterium]|nr:hypothetical protein [Alphaproteobacteria bacterium]